MAEQIDKLAIEVLLTKSDIARTVRLRAMRQPLFWITVMMPGIIIYGAAITYPYSWIVGMLVSLGLFFLIPYRAIAASVKQADVLSPIIYIFSEYGVTAQFQNAENKTAWSLVKGARETDDFILVEMQRNSFHLLPKRMMSEGQCASLRDILRVHLSKNIHLAK